MDAVAAVIVATGSEALSNFMFASSISRACRASAAIWCFIILVYESEVEEGKRVGRAGKRVHTAIVVEQGIEEVGEVLDNVSKGGALRGIIIRAPDAKIDDGLGGTGVGQ